MRPSLTFALVIMLSGPAAAQSIPKHMQLSAEEDTWDDSTDHEWSLGISHERRETARRLFTQGNGLLNESMFPAAVEAYQAALTHWNHPNIHFNLALALINLDKPLEVREHLIMAMQYGAWPLKEQRFNHAARYLTLLESQLVRVRIRCDVPGAQVTIDGEPLLTPPGEAERWVKAGRHFIVATKGGYFANEVNRAFDPGARVHLDLELSTERELTTYHRRWSKALPWTMIGAGAAAAIAGGGLYYAGIKAKEGLEAGAKERCPKGCLPGQFDATPKDVQSTRLQTAAIGAFAVGGAALVAGGILQYLNRAQALRRSYETDVPEETKPGVSLAPILEKEAGGALAVVRF